MSIQNALMALCIVVGFDNNAGLRLCAGYVRCTNIVVCYVDLNACLHSGASCRSVSIVGTMLSHCGMSLVPQGCAIKLSCYVVDIPSSSLGPALH